MTRLRLQCGNGAPAAGPASSTFAVRNDRHGIVNRQCLHRAVQLFRIVLCPSVVDRRCGQQLSQRRMVKPKVASWPRRCSRAGFALAAAHGSMRGKWQVGGAGGQQVGGKVAAGWSVASIGEAGLAAVAKRVFCCSSLPP